MMDGDFYLQIQQNGNILYADKIITAGIIFPVNFKYGFNGDSPGFYGGFHAEDFKLKSGSCRSGCFW